MSVRLLPEGLTPPARTLLWGRGLRAFADGLVSPLLPVYLSTLGFSALEVGVLVTATLLGSAALTLAVGMAAHRLGRHELLVAAALLMIATGIGFLLETDYWPLLAIAFLGTLNPSSGDVSVFLPLEQALMADSVADRHRTSVFAAYGLVGSLVAALGSLAAGFPDLLRELISVSIASALQGMFAVYTLVGLATFLLYRRLPSPHPRLRPQHQQPLGPSKGIVLTLAGLFSIDAFGGGFFVQSLLALWLFDRFGLSASAVGAIFFATGVLAAFSFPAAAWLSKRIGLVNTMVFTHLPSNLCLILMPFAPSLWVALALLLVRSALSQMDVPTRTSYVMAVVTPGERAAAASVTSVPRSLASAVSPSIAGYLLTLSGFGWPLVIGGALKGIYDLLLLVMFRHVRPPEEQPAE
ncbi:MAG TPA: MFS transporter [Stellaceae bacterium]|nr:MFS transporter [Stellaceae bacterium]